jgi:peptidoglycan/xylan/chitin deacetylase (PgdA/CDA1 family)
MIGAGLHGRTGVDRVITTSLTSGASQRVSPLAKLRVVLIGAGALVSTLLVAPAEVFADDIGFSCPMLYYHDVPSQAGLEAQLNTLIRSGYRPTTISAVLDALDGETPPPPGCIVLTFDDALRSQHRNALPVLSRWAVNGTFFMMPSFRDGVHVYMTPEEIQEVAVSGMEIGSHTLNHANLPALRRANLGAFFAEIIVSRSQIENLIGRPVDLFAYPNGAVDAPTAAEIQSAGYRGAATTIQGAWQTSNLRYYLRRYPANSWEAPSEIVTRIRS